MIFIEPVFSRGKVMLAGEYFVLMGSKAIALPLQFGQHLEATFVESGPHEVLWKTFQGESQIMEFNFSMADITQRKYNPEGNRGYVLKLLRAARRANPEFLSSEGLTIVETRIDTALKNGLGMSSSLISNLGYLANVDPFRLNRMVSKGSGYDVAAARASGSIVYQKGCSEPVIQQIDLPSQISSQLFLVHLNKKENTDTSISLYLRLLRNKRKAFVEMNTIIDAMLMSREIKEFGLLMEKHDAFLSKVLNRKSVKELYFDDFEGWIKSSGAWGGDYILAATEAGESDVKAYFGEKGFKSVYKLDQLTYHG